MRFWFVPLLGLFFLPLAAACSSSNNGKTASTTNSGGAMPGMNMQSNGGMMPNQAPAAAATGPAASPVPGARAVNVDLAEYSVKLDTASVPAGPVHFVVRNAGQRGHQLQIYPVGSVSENNHGAQMTQGGMMQGTIGSLQIIVPVQTAELDVSLPAGRWELACHMQDSENGKNFDHYDRGMKATLTVS